MGFKKDLCFVLACCFIWGCSPPQKEQDKKPILKDVERTLDSAIFYVDSNQDELARYWLRITDSLASIVNDEKTRSNVLANSGWMFHRKYEYDSALVAYSLSLEFAKNVRDTLMQIDRYQRLSRVYRDYGQFYRSVEKLEDGFDLAQEINNEQKIASISSSLGHVFSDLDEPERAMEYYVLTAKIRERDKSRMSSYAIALHNIGSTYIDLDSSLKAIPILNRALEIKDSLGLNKSKAYTLSALGGAYLKLDQLDQSKEMFYESYIIREEVGDKAGVAQVFFRLGKVNFEENDLKEALKNLTKAEELAIEVRNPELLRSILEEKKKLFKASNSLRALLEADEIYDILTDSLQRKQRLKVQEAQAKAELQREQQKTAIAEQNARIANIEAESERQKGQLRLYLVLVALLGIVIASWQLWQIRKRNASLITLNERIKLITDNAFHSQKNALGLISALLRSKARQTAHDKELEVLRDVEGKIEALGGVAKYLFQTRLTDNIEVAASIQLATYLETLIQDTFSSVASDMAKLEIKLEEISVTSTEALNIGLIANEAITNFSKYAETFGADELQIKTKRQESELLLQIRDNGPGFPEGFNISKSTGFGMQMMANLVDDMEGTLSMFRQEGWTLIQITIPLKA